MGVGQHRTARRPKFRHRDALRDRDTYQIRTVSVCGLRYWYAVGYHFVSYETERDFFIQSDDL